VQDYFDSQEKGGIIKRALKRTWRYIKILAVVAATRMYFHKHKVMDSYEVIKNA
jgi:hypothetical protein